MLRKIYGMKKKHYVKKIEYKKNRVIRNQDSWFMAHG